MGKRTKVLSFRPWLNNLAMEDELLGRISLFLYSVAVIAVEFTYVRENGLNKMAEGKEHKFRGFPVFHI